MTLGVSINQKTFLFFRMKIRYSFRSEKKKLPEPKIILETTRQLHNEFIQNPSKFWNTYKEWLRPMNCLVPGHFISINEDSRSFKFIQYYNNSCALRLEYMELGKNYVKVTFEIDDAIPYKVSSGIILKTRISTNINFQTPAFQLEEHFPVL